MTLIEASENKNNTSKPESKNKTEEVVEETSNVTTEGILVDSKTDQNQVLIKTETRTGYVNIDGTEREKSKNESSLTDIVKERISKYYNSSNLEAKVEDSEITVDESPSEKEKLMEKNVEVDDIIVAQKPQEPENDRLQPPSVTRAKEAYKLLPKVIQEFLNNDWKTKPKCEPQRMLERIRKENRYPDHIDVDAYELLLTPAPSFLQRISIAGEFLTKKQLQT